MTEQWTKAVGIEELPRGTRTVVRTGDRQIALFHTEDGLFACNNRCPHEGYPLREGSLDGACVLTCNWHNWKFDLHSGANLYGGDRLRVYPVELRGDDVWIDLADPPFAERRAAVIANLRAAFDDHGLGLGSHDRLAREVARLRLIGADPREALAAAIEWSHDRLEFGWTHAYAGAADWLALYDERGNEPETQLICLLEAIGHIAYDVLRQRTYAYAEDSRPYDAEALVRAIEDEDEAAAAALVRGALEDGLGFADLEEALSRAALAHYADFGHSLIYVSKAGALIERLGQGVALPLLLSLVRSLVFARREDRIPEFRGYGPALAAWGGKPNGAAPPAAEYARLNAAGALALTAAHGGAPAPDIYRSLLAANARHMRDFDESYARHVDRPIRDNVGWLDFTHGLTFAHAVRRQCTRFPELWPAGLLQMACFSGRNAPYTDPGEGGARWRVADHDRFFADAVDALFDHGRDEYIVSVHLAKTLLAAREEVSSGAAGEAADDIVAALNRFLQAPLKRRHLRRSARQAMAVVALDG